MVKSHIKVSAELYCSCFIFFRKSVIKALISIWNKCNNQMGKIIINNFNLLSFTEILKGFYSKDDVIIKG